MAAAASGQQSLWLVAAAQLAQPVSHLLQHRLLSGYVALCMTQLVFQLCMAQLQAAAGCWDRLLATTPAEAVVALCES